MQNEFPVHEVVPVDPGTSPFRMRGVVYANMLHDVRSLPGGMERFSDELVDARVRDFVRQKFEFMTWYDALPCVPCSALIARTRGKPLDAHMREVGRTYMLKMIPSMFRMLSRLGGPRFAAAHAPRLFASYYDFLQLRISNVGDLDGSGKLSGIPTYLAPMMLGQIAGIITGALESLGATGVEAGYRDFAVGAGPNGFELMTCHADFRWRLAHKKQATGS